MSEYKNDGKFVLKTKKEDNKDFKQFNKNLNKEKRTNKEKKHFDKQRLKRYRKDKINSAKTFSKTFISSAMFLLFLLLFNFVLKTDFNFFNRSGFDFNISNYSTGIDYYMQFHTYDKNKVLFKNYNNFTWEDLQKGETTAVSHSTWSFKQHFITQEEYKIYISAKGDFEGILTLNIIGNEDRTISFDFENVSSLNSWFYDFERANEHEHYYWVFTFEDFTTKSLNLQFYSIRNTQNYELREGSKIVDILSVSIDYLTSVLDFISNIFNTIFDMLDALIFWIKGVIGL